MQTPLNQGFAWPRLLTTARGHFVQRLACILGKFCQQSKPDFWIFPFFSDNLPGRAKRARRYLRRATPVAMRLSKRIQVLRRLAGLTQDDLAALLKKKSITQSTLLKIESGKTRDPRWSTMLALADALGVSVADLRDESPDPRPARFRKNK